MKLFRYPSYSKLYTPNQVQNIRSKKRQIAAPYNSKLHTAYHLPDAQEQLKTFMLGNFLEESKKNGTFGRKITTQKELEDR